MGVETVPPWFVSSFYRFIPIESGQLDVLRQEIESAMTEHRVNGLVILAHEGINGTISGTKAGVGAVAGLVQERLEIPPVRFKESVSDKRPFRRRNVVIRPEIVTLKRPDLVPESPENSHLSPSEWNEMLQSQSPKLLIDTRNRYETKAGKFRDAIDPEINTFSEWGAFLDQAELPKDLPVMIYCTGGIRCEKAILEMHNRGFEKVFQLRDGILGYLAEFPEGQYEGECYVFDDRVALDKHLEPTTQYGVCPGCGLTAELIRNCEWCGKNYHVCSDCEPKRPNVCSKPCLSYWTRHGPKDQVTGKRSS